MFVKKTGLGKDWFSRGKRIFKKQGAVCGIAQENSGFLQKSLN